MFGSLANDRKYAIRGNNQDCLKSKKSMEINKENGSFEEQLIKYRADLFSNLMQSVIC